MDYKCSIEFNITNSAFSNFPHIEAARIVKMIANRIYDGEDSGCCMDINGNHVGDWYIDLPEEDAND